VDPVTLQDRMLVITVFFESPWAKLSRVCMGVHKDGRDKLRWNIPAEPKGWRRWLEGIANWAEAHDREWKLRYVEAGTNPPRRWRRR
jgi:hypothetical protein